MLKCSHIFNYTSCISNKNFQGPETTTKQPNFYGEIPNDPYEALGVTPSNTKAEIRIAYTKLTKKFHPDVAKEHIKDAEEWYRVVAEAYSVITDKNNLGRSNQYFKNWQRPQGKTYRERTHADEERERARAAEQRRNWDANERAREEQQKADKKKKDREAEAARAAASASSRGGTPPPPADPEAELRKEVEAKVVEARLKYADAKVAYKNKDRANYAWLKDIRAGLGFERTTQKDLKVAPKNMEDVRDALQSSLEEYVQAKVLLKKILETAPVTDAERIATDPAGTILNPKTLKFIVVRKRLLDKAEDEWKLLQKQIGEREVATATPKSRNSFIEQLDSSTKTLQKGLKYWRGLPPVVRNTLSAVLIGTVTAAAASFILGSVGAVGAGVAAAKIRGAMGISSAVTTGIAGAGWDKRVKRLNAKTKAKNSSAYLEDTVSETDREIADMENREKEVKTRRKQRLTKAGIMLGTGLGTSVGSAILSDLSNSIDGIHTPDAKGPIFEGYLDENPDQTDIDTEVGGGGDISPEPPKADVTSEGYLDENPDQVDSRYEEGNGDESVTDVSDQNPVAPQSEGYLDENPDQTDIDTEVGEVATASSPDDDFVGPLQPESTATGNPEVLSVKVASSPKGFLQDIIDLKAKVKASYGDNPIPPGVQKNLLDKSYMELAKEYGMYKPDETLNSGMSMKGAHLGVDSEGHLVYEYKGQSRTMYDYDAGEVKSFKDIGGKMFEPKPLKVEVSAPATEPTVSTNAPVGAYPDSINDDIKFGGRTPENITDRTYDEGVDFTKNNSSVESNAGDIDPSKHIDLDGGKSVDIQNIATDEKGVVFGDKLSREVIGHETELPNGQKIYRLDDKHIESAGNHEQRTAFNEMIGKSIDKKVVFGPDHQQISFERGGVLDIARDSNSPTPNGLGVFLDGKKIAEGVITDKGPKIDFINDSTINKHNGFARFFAGPTVYERALEEAKEFIKTNMKVKK